MIDSIERQRWLAERMTGLGSSEAAPILGLSPWSTALEVYMRHVGLLPPQNETPAMKWGARLEDAIAEAYQEETGRLLDKPGFQIMRHPEHEWMITSLDRLATDGTIVELKTANAFAHDEWGEPGTDQIPEVYLIQVNHQLAVTEQLVADVAVLIGGQDFRIYTVPRNDAVIASMIAIEQDFWQRIQNRNPPGPDWSHPNTPKLMESLHGLEPAKETVLPEAAEQLISDYESLKETIDKAESQRSECKARLLDLMAGAAKAWLPDGRWISRKQIDIPEKVSKAYSFSNFIIHEAKKVKVKT